MKVFSIEKYKESLKDIYKQNIIEDALWAKKCDGKTKEEIEKMGISIDDSWTIEKEESLEESLNEWIENELKKEVEK